MESEINSQMARLSQTSSLLLPRPMVKILVASFFHCLFGANGRSMSRIAVIGWERVGISSNRNTHSRFRTFCTGQDLSTKKCVPCNTKDLRSMTEQAANDLVSKVDGWKLVNEGGVLKLHRGWKVKSFTKGLELFKLVAEIAEAEAHHPDLHLVGWNNVTIEIWTHAVGGLTENDFILASKINHLDMHHLLGRKVTT